MSIAGRRHGIQARPWREALRRVGWAMVVLLAMAQVGAAAHFVLVRHALSLGQAGLIHCGDGDSPDSKKAPLSHHEGCEIFAVLCQASSVATLAPQVDAPDAVIRSWAQSGSDHDVIRAWPLFMLAPSQSPPAGAA